MTNVVLSSSNHIATLTLASPVANGGVLNITAKGTNPVANGATQPNEMTVAPGNGASETSNAITFGQSVTGVSVSASSRVAGASSNYFVSFKVSVPIPTGASIFLSEAAGQTDFGAVTGIEVSDITESWHLVATGSTLANGLAKVPLSALSIAAILWRSSSSVSPTLGRVPSTTSPCGPPLTPCRRTLRLIRSVPAPG